MLRIFMIIVWVIWGSVYFAIGGLLTFIGLIFLIWWVVTGQLGTLTGKVSEDQPLSTLVMGTIALVALYIYNSKHTDYTALGPKAVGLIIAWYFLYNTINGFLCYLKITCSLVPTTIMLFPIATVNIVLRVQQHRDNVKKFKPNTNIKPFNINGPPMFMLAVDQVIDELRERDKETYQALITKMPQIIYYSKLRVSADARGVFSLDGSDYEALRFMIFHILGHQQYTGGGEGEADTCAEIILDKIGAVPYKRDWRLTCGGEVNRSFWEMEPP